MAAEESGRKAQRGSDGRGEVKMDGAVSLLVC